eukprot:g24.t1
MQEHVTYFLRRNRNGEVSDVEFDSREEDDVKKLKRSLISVFGGMPTSTIDGRDARYYQSEIVSDGTATFRRRCRQISGSDQEKQGLLRSRCTKEFLSFPDSNKIKNRSSVSVMDTILPHQILLRSHNVERFEVRSEVQATAGSLAGGVGDIAGNVKDHGETIVIRSSAEVTVTLNVELVHSTDKLGVFDTEDTETSLFFERAGDEDEWYPAVLAWGIEATRDAKSRRHEQRVMQMHCRDQKNSESEIDIALLDLQEFEESRVARLSAKRVNRKPSKDSLRELFERAMDAAAAEEARRLLSHLMNALKKPKTKEIVSSFVTSTKQSSSSKNAQAGSPPATVVTTQELPSVDVSPEDSLKAIASFIHNAFLEGEIKHITQQCAMLEGCQLVPFDSASAKGGLCVDPCEYALYTAGDSATSNDIDAACKNSGHNFCAYGAEAAKLTKQSKKTGSATCVVRCKYLSDEKDCKSPTVGLGCRWKSSKLGRPGRCEAVTQTQTGMLMQVLQNMKSLILKANNKASVVKNLEDNANNLNTDAIHADETTGEKKSQFGSLIIKIVDKILDSVLTVDLTSLIRFLHNAAIFNKRLIAGEASLVGGGGIVRFDPDHVLAPVFEKLDPTFDALLEAAEAVERVLMRLRSIVEFPFAKKSLVNARAAIRAIEKACQKSDVDSNTCPYLSEQDVKRHRLLFSKKHEDRSGDTADAPPVPMCFLWDSKAYACANSVKKETASAGDASPLTAERFASDSDTTAATCTAKSGCTWRGSANTAANSFPECAPKNCADGNSFCVARSGEGFSPPVHAAQCVRHHDSGKLEPMPGLDLYPAVALKYTDWCDMAECGAAPKGQCGDGRYAHCEEDYSNRCLDKCSRMDDSSDPFTCEENFGCRWIKARSDDTMTNDQRTSSDQCVSTPTNSNSKVSFLAVFTEVPPWDAPDKRAEQTPAQDFPRNCEVSQVVRNVQRAHGVGVVFAMDMSSVSVAAERYLKLKRLAASIDLNRYNPNRGEYSSVAVPLDDPLDIPVVFTAAPLPGVSLNDSPDSTGGETPMLALSSPRSTNVDKCYGLCVRRKKAFAGITAHFMDFLTLVNDLVDTAAHLYTSISVGLVAAGEELVEALYRDHLEEFGLFSSVHNRTLGNPQILAVTLRTQFDLSLNLDSLGGASTRDASKSADDEVELQKCVALIDAHVSSAPKLCTTSVANQCKEQCLADTTTASKAITAVDSEAVASAAKVKATTRAKLLRRLRTSKFKGQMEIALDFSALGGSYTAVSLNFKPTLHGSYGWSVPAPTLNVLGVEVPIDLDAMTTITKSLKKMGVNFLSSCFRNQQLQRGMTQTIVHMLRDPKTIYGRWLGAPDRFLGGAEETASHESSTASCASFDRRAPCEASVDEDGAQRCIWKAGNVDRHCVTRICASRSQADCEKTVSGSGAASISCAWTNVLELVPVKGWDGSTKGSALKPGQFVYVKSEASTLSNDVYQVVSNVGNGDVTLSDLSNLGSDSDFSTIKIDQIVLAEAIDQHQCIEGVPELSMRTATLADVAAPMIRFLDILHSAFEHSGIDIAAALRGIELNANCQVKSPIPHFHCRMLEALRRRLTNPAMRVESESVRINMDDLLRFVRSQLATAVENLASASAGGIPVSIFGRRGVIDVRFDEEISRMEIEQQEESSEMNLESAELSGNDLGVVANSMNAQMRLKAEQLVIETSQVADAMSTRQRACEGIREFCMEKISREICESVSLVSSTSKSSDEGHAGVCQWRESGDEDDEGSCDLGPRYRGIRTSWITSMEVETRQDAAELLGEVARLNDNSHTTEDIEQSNTEDALKRQVAIDLLMRTLQTAGTTQWGVEFICPWRYVVGPCTSPTCTRDAKTSPSSPSAPKVDASTIGPTSGADSWFGFDPDPRISTTTHAWSFKKPSLQLGKSMIHPINEMAIVVVPQHTTADEDDRCAHEISLLKERQSELSALKRDLEKRKGVVDASKSVQNSQSAPQNVWLAVQLLETQTNLRTTTEALEALQASCDAQKRKWAEMDPMTIVSSTARETGFDGVEIEPSSSPSSKDTSAHSEGTKVSSEFKSFFCNNNFVVSCTEVEPVFADDAVDSSRVSAQVLLPAGLEIPSALMDGESIDVSIDISPARSTTLARRIAESFERSISPSQKQLALSASSEVVWKWFLADTTPTASDTAKMQSELLSYWNSVRDRLHDGNATVESRFRACINDLISDEKVNLMNMLRRIGGARIVGETSVQAPVSGPSTGGGSFRSRFGMGTLTNLESYKGSGETAYTLAASEDVLPTTEDSFLATFEIFVCYRRMASKSDSILRASVGCSPEAKLWLNGERGYKVFDDSDAVTPVDDFKVVTIKRRVNLIRKTLQSKRKESQRRLDDVSTAPASGSKSNPVTDSDLAVQVNKMILSAKTKLLQMSRHVQDWIDDARALVASSVPSEMDTIRHDYAIRAAARPRSETSESVRDLTPMAMLATAFRSLLSEISANNFGPAHRFLYTTKEAESKSIRSFDRISRGQFEFCPASYESSSFGSMSEQARNSLKMEMNMIKANVKKAYTSLGIDDQPKQRYMETYVEFIDTMCFLRLVVETRRLIDRVGKELEMLEDTAQYLASSIALDDGGTTKSSADMARFRREQRTAHAAKFGRRQKHNRRRHARSHDSNDAASFVEISERLSPGDLEGFDVSSFDRDLAKFAAAEVLPRALQIIASNGNLICSEAVPLSVRDALLPGSLKDLTRCAKYFRETPRKTDELSSALGNSVGTVLEIYPSAMEFLRTDDGEGSTRYVDVARLSVEESILGPFASRQAFAMPKLESTMQTMRQIILSGQACGACVEGGVLEDIFLGAKAAEYIAHVAKVGRDVGMSASNIVTTVMNKLATAIDKMEILFDSHGGDLVSAKLDLERALDEFEAIVSIGGELFHDIQALTKASEEGLTPELVDLAMFFPHLGVAAAAISRLIVHVVKYPKEKDQSEGSLSKKEEWRAWGTKIMGTLNVALQCPVKPGTQSSSTVSCSGHGMCDEMSGMCRCAKGWIGSACDVGPMYGAECEENAQCGTKSGPLGGTPICQTFEDQDAKECRCHTSASSGLVDPDYVGVACAWRRCTSEKDAQVCRLTGSKAGHVACNVATGMCMCAEGYEYDLSAPRVGSHTEMQQPGCKPVDNVRGDGLIVDALKALQRTEAQMERSEHLRGSYSLAAVRLCQKSIDGIRGLLKGVIRLKTIGSNGYDRAPPNVESYERIASGTAPWMLPQKKPNHLLCPDGRMPSDVDSNDWISKTEQELMPTIGVTFPVMGVPVVVEFAILGDFIVKFESGTCKSTAVPGDFFQRLGAGASCTQDYECLSGLCNLRVGGSNNAALSLKPGTQVTYTDESHNRKTGTVTGTTVEGQYKIAPATVAAVSQGSDSADAQAAVADLEVDPDKVQPVETDITRDARAVDPYAPVACLADDPNQCECAGPLSSSSSGATKARKPSTCLSSRTPCASGSWCTTGGECKEGLPPNQPKTTDVMSVAPALILVAYAELRTGIGLQGLLSAGLFGRIVVVDITLPVQLDVATEYMTGAARIDPIFGALSGSVGLYAKFPIRKPFYLTLYKWRGISKRVRGPCKQFPSVKKIDSEGHLEPRPVLCKGSALPRPTDADHPADPPMRPSLNDTCYPCEFRATRPCGTIRCMPSPSRYAATAGVEVDRVFNAWWKKNVQSGVSCIAGSLAYGVESVHVCQEQVSTGPQGFYRAVYAIKWRQRGKNPCRWKKGDQSFCDADTIETMPKYLRRTQWVNIRAVMLTNENVVFEKQENLEHPLPPGLVAAYVPKLQMLEGYNLRMENLEKPCFRRSFISGKALERGTSMLKTCAFRVDPKDEHGRLLGAESGVVAFEQSAVLISNDDLRVVDATNNDAKCFAYDYAGDATIFDDAVSKSTIALRTCVQTPYQCRALCGGIPACTVFTFCPGTGGGLCALHVDSVRASVRAATKAFAAELYELMGEQFDARESQFGPAASRTGRFDVPDARSSVKITDDADNSVPCLPMETFESATRGMNGAKSKDACFLWMWPPARPIFAFVFRSLISVSPRKMNAAATAATAIETEYHLVGLRRTPVEMPDFDDPNFGKKRPKKITNDPVTSVDVVLSSPDDKTDIDPFASSCVKGEAVDSTKNLCNVGQSLTSLTNPGSTLASTHANIVATRRCYECAAIGRYPPMYTRRRLSRYPCPRIGQRVLLRKAMSDSMQNPNLAQSIVDFGIEACISSSAFLDIVSSNMQRRDIDPTRVRVVVCNEQYDLESRSLDATIIVSPRDPTAPVKNRIGLVVRINVPEEDEADDGRIVEESDCTILSHETQLHSLMGTPPTPSCDDDRYVYATAIATKVVQWETECDAGDAQCLALRHLLCGTQKTGTTGCDSATALSSVKFYEARCVGSVLGDAETIILNSESALSLISQCPMICELTDPCIRMDITTTLEMLQDGLYVESERQRACENPDLASVGETSTSCQWVGEPFHACKRKSLTKGVVTFDAPPPSSTALLAMNIISHDRPSLRKHRSRHRQHDRHKTNGLSKDARFVQKHRHRVGCVDTFSVKGYSTGWTSRRNSYKLSDVVFDRQSFTLSVYAHKKASSSKPYVVMNLKSSTVVKQKSTNSQEYNRFTITSNSQEYNFRYEHSTCMSQGTNICMTEKAFFTCFDLFSRIALKKTLPSTFPSSISTCATPLESTQLEPTTQTESSPAPVQNVPQPKEETGQKKLKEKSVPLSPKALRPKVKATYDLWLDWNEEWSEAAKRQTPCLPTPTIDRTSPGNPFESAVTPFGAYLKDAYHASDDATLEEAVLLAAEAAKNETRLLGHMSPYIVDVNRFRGMEHQPTGQCFPCEMKKTSRSSLFSRSRSFDSMDLSCAGQMSEISRRRIFMPPENMREQFESARFETTQSENLKQGGEKCTGDVDCESGRCKRQSVLGSKECVEAGTKTADESCKKDSECLSAECKTGMFGGSGSCTNPSTRVMKRRDSDLYSIVETLLRVVHRYSASRDLLHRRDSGGPMPWYTSCDEYSMFERESGTLSVYGGVLCSRLMFETKCVRWYVDKFVDAPEYGERTSQFREVVDQWDSQSLLMLQRSATGVKSGSKGLQHLTSTKSHALHIQGLHADSEMCKSYSLRERARICKSASNDTPDWMMATQIQKKSSSQPECWDVGKMASDPLKAATKKMLISSGCLSLSARSLKEDVNSIIDFVANRAFEILCGECDTLNFKATSAFKFPSLEQYWKPIPSDPAEALSGLFRADALNVCAKHGRPRKKTAKQIPACWERLSSKMLSASGEQSGKTFEKPPTSSYVFITSYPKESSGAVNAWVSGSSKEIRVFSFKSPGCAATGATLTRQQHIKTEDMIAETLCAGESPAKKASCKKEILTKKKLHAVEDTSLPVIRWCSINMNNFVDENDDGIDDNDRTGTSILARKIRKSSTECASALNDDAVSGGWYWNPENDERTIKFQELTISSKMPTYRPNTITFAMVVMPAPCNVWYESEERSWYTRSSKATWHKCVGYEQSFEAYFDMRCTLSGIDRNPQKCETSECARVQTQTAVCGDLVTFDVPAPQELISALFPANLVQVPGSLPLENPSRMVGSDVDRAVYQLACFPEFKGYSNAANKYTSKKCADYTYKPAVVYNSPEATSWTAYVADESGHFRGIAATIDASVGKTVANTFLSTCAASNAPAGDGSPPPREQNALDALTRIMGPSCDESPTLLLQSLTESAARVAFMEKSRGDVARAYEYLAEKFYSHQAYAKDSEMEQRQCAAAVPGFPS